MDGLVLPVNAGPDQSRITDYFQRQEAPRRENKPEAFAATATLQKQIRREQRECPRQEGLLRAAKRPPALTAEEHAQASAQRVWRSVVQNSPATATLQKQIRREQRECSRQEGLLRAAKRPPALTAEEHAHASAQRVWRSVVQNSPATATLQKQIRREQTECSRQEGLLRAAKRPPALTAEEHAHASAQRVWRSVVQKSPATATLQKQIRREQRECPRQEEAHLAAKKRGSRSRAAHIASQWHDQPRRSRLADLHRNHPTILSQRVQSKAHLMKWEGMSKNTTILAMLVLDHLPEVMKGSKTQMTMRQMMFRNNEAVGGFETFDASHSHIIGFDGRLADRLFSCKTLLLSHNGLTTFPEELNGTDKADEDHPGLEALTTLDISHNQISRLPAFFAERFLQLRVLNLSYNNLKVVPSEVRHHMERMTRLDLGHNKIESTMKAMTFLTSGQYIFGCLVILDGNPLLKVRPKGEQKLVDMGAIRDPARPTRFTLQDQAIDIDFDELD